MIGISSTQAVGGRLALRARMRHPGAFLRQAAQICAIATPPRTPGEDTRTAVPEIAPGPGRGKGSLTIIQVICRMVERARRAPKKSGSEAARRVTWRADRGDHMGAAKRRRRPMMDQSSSLVRAAALRNSALSLAISCSIGRPTKGEPVLGDAKKRRQAR